MTIVAKNKFGSSLHQRATNVGSAVDVQAKPLLIAQDVGNAEKRKVNKQVVARKEQSNGELKDVKNQFQVTKNK